MILKFAHLKLLVLNFLYQQLVFWELRLPWSQTCPNLLCKWIESNQYGWAVLKPITKCMRCVRVYQPWRRLLWQHYGRQLSPTHVHQALLMVKLTQLCRRIVFGLLCRGSAGWLCVWEGEVNEWQGTMRKVTHWIISNSTDVTNSPCSYCVTSRDVCSHVRRHYGSSDKHSGLLLA